MSIEEERTRLGNFPFPLLLTVSFSKLIDLKKWKDVYGPMPQFKLFPLLMDQVLATPWPIGQGEQKVKLDKKGGGDETFPGIKQAVLDEVVAGNGYFNIRQQINNRMNVQTEKPGEEALRSAAYSQRAATLTALKLPPGVPGLNSYTPSGVDLPLSRCPSQYTYQAILATQAFPLIKQFSNDLTQIWSEETPSVFGDLIPRYQALMAEQSVAWADRFSVTVPSSWPPDAFASFGDCLFPHDPLTLQHLTLDVIEPILHQWRSAGVMNEKAEVHPRVEAWLAKLRQIRNGLFQLGVMYWRAQQLAPNREIERVAVAPWLAQLLYAWDDEGDISITPLPSNPVIAGFSKAVREDPRRRASSRYEASLLPCSPWSAYYTHTQNESTMDRADVRVVIAEAHPTEKANLVERLVGRTRFAHQHHTYDRDLVEEWAKQLNQWLWDTREGDPSRVDWKKSMCSQSAIQVVGMTESTLQAKLADKKRAKRTQSVERDILSVLRAMIQTWASFLYDLGVTWGDVLPSDPAFPDPRVLALEQHLLSTKDEDGKVIPGISSDAYRQGLSWRFNLLSDPSRSDV